MRIATWNVERLKHYKNQDAMLQEIEAISADILILTETDSRLCPEYAYMHSTLFLKELRPRYYKDTENRVTVFSKYPCIRQHETYDRFTAICVELNTEMGPILVYGTIMGIFGNREKSFLSELTAQMCDIQRLSDAGLPICVAGDYNLSFGDNYYYTKVGREAVLQTFTNCGIELLTKAQPECIDHIAVSNRFFGKVLSVEEWNREKTLSDHKGIVVELEEKLL